MAFFIHSVDDGHVPPNECLPAAAITPKAGMALVQSSGNLSAASGANKPTYICLQEGSAAVTAGTPIAVMRVSPEVVYETTLSAAGTSLTLGAKVTLASGGLQVTATTTDGVAEVVGFPDGTKASGNSVLVRFA